MATYGNKWLAINWMMNQIFTQKMVGNNHFHPFKIEFQELVFADIFDCSSTSGFSAFQNWNNFWLDILAGMLAILLVFTGQKGMFMAFHRNWYMYNRPKCSSSRIHPRSSSQKMLLLLATFLIPLASCITVCTNSLCIKRNPGAKCEVKIFGGNSLECFVCCKGLERCSNWKVWNWSVELEELARHLKAPNQPAPQPSPPFFQRVKGRRKGWWFLWSVTLMLQTPGQLVGIRQTTVRWAPTGCKWGYGALYRWPYIWGTGVITPKFKQQSPWKNGGKGRLDPVLLGPSNFSGLIC